MLKKHILNNNKVGTESDHLDLLCNDSKDTQKKKDKIKKSSPTGHTWPPDHSLPGLLQPCRRRRITCLSHSIARFSLCFQSTSLVDDEAKTMVKVWQNELLDNFMDFILFFGLVMCEC